MKKRTKNINARKNLTPTNEEGGVKGNSLEKAYFSEGKWACIQPLSLEWRERLCMDFP